jgi:hypothetical protein
MKKTTILLVFFLSAAGLLAQTDGDFRFGFQVSPTFSWMSSDVTYINPNGTNTALKLGAIGEFYFRENYAITGGIGFAFNLGGTQKYDYGGQLWTRSDLGPALDTLPNGVNLKYNLQYVEIPLGLKMRTREFGYLRYFAEIPIIYLGFKSQAQGTIQAAGIDETEKLQIKPEVNGIALSWGLGGGVEYGISTNTSLVGGVYFQRSFTDITDDNGKIFHPSRGNIDNNSKSGIGALTVRLGVIF